MSSRSGRAVRTVATLPAVAGSVGKELGWLALHAALYPAGLLADRVPGEDPRYRMDPLTPVSRGLILGDIAAHGTPIVLVHGIVDNRSAFAVLRRALRRRGFDRISTVNYAPWTADLRSAAARLHRHVERVCAQTGYEQVYVVGHSLGGLVARYYVQCLDGDRRVDTLVTLGTPHGGTQLARLAPVFVARELRPGCRAMRELAARTRCSTRFVAVWSDRDEVVLPHRNAQLHHPDLDATNVAVPGVGHLSLLVDGRAVQAVLAALGPRSAAGRFTAAT